MQRIFSAKPLIALLCVVMIGCSILINRYAEKIVRAEKSGLSLARQNSALTSALKDAEAQNHELALQVETQTAEIAKLRGQLTREKKLGLPASPLEPGKSIQQSTNVDPPQIQPPAPASIPVANWRDLGGVTAENAVQSFLWSLRTRNPERLVELVDPADREALVTEGEAFATELAKVTGYRVLNSIDVSPTQRMLHLQLDEENGEMKTEEFHFVKIGGQWRFSENAKVAYLKVIESLKR